MSISIFKRGQDTIPCNICRKAESSLTNPMLDVKISSASDNVDVSLVAAVHRSCLKRKIDEAPE